MAMIYLIVGNGLGIATGATGQFPNLTPRDAMSDMSLG
jgi:hypothetical protein